MTAEANIVNNKTENNEKKMSQLTWSTPGATRSKRLKKNSQKRRVRPSRKLILRRWNRAQESTLMPNVKEQGTMTIEFSPTGN